MKITPIEGELTRFHVTSDKGSDIPPYLCNLLSFWGNGQCSCPNFRFKVGPIVALRQHTEPKRCKHLRACVIFFANEVLMGMSEKEMKSCGIPKVIRNVAANLKANE